MTDNTPRDSQSLSYKRSTKQIKQRSKEMKIEALTNDGMIDLMHHQWQKWIRR